jgi:hypothetical protein
MSRTCERTTVLRIHTSRCDDANSRCKGSSRPDQPSAFSPFTPPSTTFSMSSVISHPATRSAFSEAKRSRRGEPQRRPELEPRLSGFHAAKTSSCDNALTPNRSAAWHRDIPSSTAPITRSRRSIERDLAPACWPPSPACSFNLIRRPLRIPSRFNQSETRSRLTGVAWR